MSKVEENSFSVQLEKIKEEMKEGIDADDYTLTCIEFKEKGEINHIICLPLKINAIAMNIVDNFINAQRLHIERCKKQLKLDEEGLVQYLKKVQELKKLKELKTINQITEEQDSGLKALEKEIEAIGLNILEGGNKDYLMQFILDYIDAGFLKMSSEKDKEKMKGIFLDCILLSQEEDLMSFITKYCSFQTLKVQAMKEKIIAHKKKNSITT